jgi:hypothetical protein
MIIGEQNTDFMKFYVTAVKHHVQGSPNQAKWATSLPWFQ